jgi:hypothetical protein
MSPKESRARLAGGLRGGCKGPAQAHAGGGGQRQDGAKVYESEQRPRDAVAHNCPQGVPPKPDRAQILLRRLPRGKRSFGRPRRGGRGPPAMGEGGPGRPGAEGGARGGAATSAGPKPARWGAAPEIIRGRLRTRYRFFNCAGGAEGGRNGAHGAAVGATKFVRRLRRGGTRCGQKMRHMPHGRGSLSYTLARSCRARFRPFGVALNLCSLIAAIPPAVRVTLWGTCLTYLGDLGWL